MKKLHFLLPLVLLAAVPSLVPNANAAPFADWFNVSVPGGRTMRIWGEGDNFDAHFRTEDGRTLVFNVDAGRYEYVKKDETTGALVGVGVFLGDESENEAKLEEIPQVDVYDTSESHARSVSEKAREWDDAMGISAGWKAQKERNEVRLAEMSVSGDDPARTKETVGAVCGFTLLVDFPLLDAKGNVTNTLATVNGERDRYGRNYMLGLLNGEGWHEDGNVASVRDYYYQMSMGRLVYTNVVTEWILVPRERSYYDSNNDCGYCGRLLLRDALATLKSQPDFNSKYLPMLRATTLDGGSSGSPLALNVLFAGGSASNWSVGLWAHAWNLSSTEYGKCTWTSPSGGSCHFFKYQITALRSSSFSSAPVIGTLCHEDGHMICFFPDYYQYSRMSFQSVEGEGVGEWSLMCSANHLGGGMKPGAVDAYSRYHAGWVEPIDISLNQGWVYVTNSYGCVYRYVNPSNPREAFFFENRQKEGIDAGLAHGGLLIWRTKWGGEGSTSSANTNPSSLAAKFKNLATDAIAATNRLDNELSLEQANGSYHLERGRGRSDVTDPWYAGNDASETTGIRNSGYSGLWNDNTVSCARWSDGSPSGLKISQISECGQVMRFFVGEASSVYLGDALDNAELSFTTGGDTAWFGQHATTHDGSDAAQSGSITHGQSSWMETTVSGPGTISFWWNVSSEGSDYDYLEFSVDGVRKGKIGGTTAGWASVSFVIEGQDSHVLRWNYKKDASLSSGNDCGWVDQVVWTPSASGPSAPTSILAHDGVRTDGVTVLWEHSAGATSYSIWRNTSDVSSSATRIATGTSDAIYFDDSATPGVLYYYWVTASNASGTSGFSPSDSGYRALLAPASLSASDGTSSAAVELAWPAVAGATSYTVYRGTAANPTTVLASGVSGTAYSDIAAAVGTTYHYRVKAVCAQCSSDYSPSDSGYRVAPSGTTLSASDGTSTEQVSVSWTAVSGAASYALYRGATASAATILAYGLSTTAYSDTTAMPGTRYYYRVRAVFSDGSTGEYSTADPGYRLLAAPTGLSASDGTSPKLVNLSWDAVTGATSYTIYRGTADNPTEVLVSGVSGTSYSDSSAIAGTTYYYRVKAICPLCASDYSASDAGYRRLVAATTVSASDGTSVDYINITWTAISGVQAYNLYRSSSVSGPFDLIAEGLTERQYRDVDATPGRRYWYRIRADYGGSLGENSDPDSGYRLLSPPSNVRASDGTSTASVTISWTEASGASSYVLYRRAESPESGYSVLASDVEITAYADTTAVPGDLYQYFVVATCSLCQSDVSEPDTGYIKLSAPTGLEATDGTSTSKVSLSWNSVSGAQTYTLYRGTSANPKSVLASGLTETSYEDESADAEQEYHYRVVAYNGPRSSDYSLDETGWRRSSLSASVSAADGESTEGVAVSWDAVSGARTYNVFRGLASGTVVYANGTKIAEGLSARSFMDDTAVPGTLYWYRIQPVSASGDAGDYSTSDTGFRKMSPPTGLEATQGTLTGGVKLTWSETPAGATSYLIARGTSASSLETVATSKTKLSYTDSTAEPGKMLYYRVASVGGVSTSAWSSVVSGHRKLSPPGSVTASDGTSDAAVELSWPAVQGATSYRIYRGDEDDSTPETVLATVSSNSHADTSAAPGEYYWYRVVAVCALSESEFSKADKGHRAIPAPAGLSATDGTDFDSIRVSWSPVALATSYTLYRGTSDNPTSVRTNNLDATHFTDLYVNVARQTPLTPGVKYWYRVKANYENGTTSLYSASDSGYVGLGTPGNLVAADGASTANVALSWDAVNGAKSYLVARNTDTNEPPDVIKSGLSNATWNDSTATNGVLYWYRVAAVSPGVCTSEWSAVESGYRMLAVPANVRATAGTSTESVALSWSPVAGAETYLVYRGETQATVDLSLPFAEVDGAETEFVDARAEPGLYHWYQLAAASPVCTSAVSAAVSGYRALEGPGNLSATDGAFTNRIDVTWSPVPGAETYSLYRGTASGKVTTLVAGNLAGTSFSDEMGASVPKPGVVYWYRVQATSAAGTLSAYSDVDSGYMIPSSPALSASWGASAANVALSWPAVFGASAYNLYRCEGTNAAPSVLLKGKLSGTATTDATAVPGVLYSYALEAYNGAITGRCSSAVAGWRQVSPPAKIAAADGASADSVTVTWNASEGALSYTVLRVDPDTSATNVLATGVAGLSHVDATAVPGVVYAYSVVADGKDFSSAPGTADKGHRLIPAPTIVASDGDTTEGIRLTWDPTAYATAYIVYRGTAANPTAMVASNVVNCATIDTDVTPGVVYHYRLKAVCAAGTASDFGAADTGWRRLEAPAAPTVAVYNTTSLRASWAKVAGATHYRVYRAESENGAKTAIGSWQTGTTYTDSSCLRGVTYWYFVQAASDSSGARPGDVGPGASGTTPPVNDNWADAIAVGNDSGTVSGTNNGATMQSYEPQHAGVGSAAASVWWVWTAPSTNAVTFDASASAFDALVGVYAGTKLTSLSAVASGAGRATFDPVAGTKYYIAVAGRTSAETGRIALSWGAGSGGGDTPSRTPDFGVGTGFVTENGRTLFRLSFWAEPGFLYLVQRKESLSDRDWTTVRRVRVDAEGHHAVDIEPAEDSGFFRVLVDD